MQFRPRSTWETCSIFSYAFAALASGIALGLAAANAHQHRPFHALGIIAPLISFFDALASYVLLRQGRQRLALISAGIEFVAITFCTAAMIVLAPGVGGEGRAVGANAALAFVVFFHSGFFWLTICDLVNERFSRGTKGHGGSGGGHGQAQNHNLGPQSEEYDR